MIQPTPGKRCFIHGPIGPMMYAPGCTHCLIELARPADSAFLLWGDWTWEG